MCRAAVIAVLLIASAASAAPIERIADRASAIEIARLVASPRAQRKVAPNLRLEAHVETLRRPIALNATRQRTAKIVVEGASTIRLRLTDVARGSVILFAGEDDEVFERFEVEHSDGWGPTISGSVIYIATDSRVLSASISQVAIGIASADAISACTIDAACSDIEDEASRAIAMIRFVRGDASYVCTGGLVNDAHRSGTPYFLTAHHCISTPEEAASVEIVWDERFVSCRGPKMRSHKTYGADLLVSSPNTDVALLRLRKVPADRVFLDVELDPLADGTPIHRLSHGNGASQQFTAGIVRASGVGCLSAPRDRFVYSSTSSGSVSLGSSGAPLLLPGLRIAGQLLGLCGASPEDSCAIYNDMVDGSIVASWPLLEPYLGKRSATRRRAAGR